MFLFYTLMCRNRLEIDKNAKQDLLEVDSDFPEICPFRQISEIVSLRPDDFGNLLEGTDFRKVRVHLQQVSFCIFANFQVIPTHQSVKQEHCALL